MNKDIDINLAIQSLDKEGYVVIPNVVESRLLERIRADMDQAMDYCAGIHKRQNVGLEYRGNISDGSLLGAAHNVLSLGESFLELLDSLPCLEIVERALDSKLILNSYGAVRNIKSAKMYEYGTTPHRDVRTYRACKEMYFLFVMVDDFTESNGATHFLPGSHLRPEKPSDEYFYKNSKRSLGNAGTITIIDPRVWHAAGVNKTENPRRILTISFTRPNHKPQLDFVRDLGEKRIEKMSDNLKQLIGYYARTPASHEEWYQPLDKRFYRPDQG